jgi:hypothetical protein
MHEGKKKGPTAWVRKAITEWQKGKLVVLVYPVDKWLLMLLKAILGDHGEVRNLGDVKWLATEDGSAGKGTGRHIACFILRPKSLVEVFQEAAGLPKRTLLEADEQYRFALAAVLESGRPSVSMVQRKLNIRYREAQELFARMVREGVVPMYAAPGLSEYIERTGGAA